MSGADYVNAHDISVALGIPCGDVPGLMAEHQIPTEPRTGRYLRSAVIELLEARGRSPDLLERTYE